MHNRHRFHPNAEAIGYLAAGIVIALLGMTIPSVDPDLLGCRINAVGPDCSRMERYSAPLPVVFAPCCDGIPFSERSSPIEPFPNP